MAEQVKLLRTWSSPYALRIVWALKLKGIEYETIFEDLTHKSPLLLHYNPVHKKVPVLVHGDKAVSVSQVILEYLGQVWRWTSKLNVMLICDLLSKWMPTTDVPRYRVTEYMFTSAGFAITVEGIHDCEKGAGRNNTFSSEKLGICGRTQRVRNSSEGKALALLTLYSGAWRSLWAYLKMWL